MKTVLKQVVAVLVAVKALFAALGEAMEFQAAQCKQTPANVLARQEAAA